MLKREDGREGKENRYQVGGWRGLVRVEVKRVEEKRMVEIRDGERVIEIDQNMVLKVKLKKEGMGIGGGGWIEQ